nr:unnamed protein product [Digitaria exilis]
MEAFSGLGPVNGGQHDGVALRPARGAVGAVERLNGRSWFGLRPSARLVSSILPLPVGNGGGGGARGETRALEP